MQPRLGGAAIKTMLCTLLAIAPAASCRPKPERNEAPHEVVLDIPPASVGQATTPPPVAKPRPSPSEIGIAARPAAASAPEQLGAGPVSRAAKAPSAAPEPSAAPTQSARGPALPSEEIARTIRRIGYRCPSVAKAEGAGATGDEPQFKITCASGEIYRARGKAGHLFFRPWEPKRLSGIGR